MKAKQGVIDKLNTVLTNELTAINQYFLQSAMCENWGYGRLHEKLRALSMGEMLEAQRIVDHILYLEGVPNMQRLGRVRVGESVLENLQLDLELELSQVKALTDGIAHCVEVGDYTTRGIFEEMIRGEEEDVSWLETQLETIKQVGIERYLTQQIREGGT